MTLYTDKNKKKPINLYRILSASTFSCGGAPRWGRMFHLPVAYGRGDSYHGPRHSYLLDLVLLHVLCSPRGEISSEPCPARPCGGGSTLTAYSGDLGVAMNLGVGYTPSHSRSSAAAGGRYVRNRNRTSSCNKIRLALLHDEASDQAIK